MTFKLNFIKKQTADSLVSERASHIVQIKSVFPYRRNNKKN